MSNLTDRLRGILHAPAQKEPCLPGPPAQPAAPAIEAVLGGERRTRNEVSCFVVERRRDPEATYGRELLKTIASRLAGASAEAALVAGGTAHPPLVFFDLETTGLSGGAGTYAFLVGCGTFDDDGGFVTRQFVLLRHGDEPQLLQMVATELSRAGALVSFNGKSFDAPLIETRYLFHRLEWPGGRLPHLDVLHPARQFWGGSCSLVSLEEQQLGVKRNGDVPGFEIPERYFQFIRTGDARPLGAVLEHNRLDLLSLAGLTAGLLDLIRRGPGAARHAREALALGRVYARCGLDVRAREAYQRATVMGTPHTEASMACTDASIASTDASMASIRVAALRSLALLLRRARRYEDAAAYWRELVGLSGCPPHVAREASEALAIHHEHRVRDLSAARAFALRSLAGIAGVNAGRRPALDQAVQRRLTRLDRKISASLLPLPSLSSPPSCGFPRSGRRTSS